MATLNIAGHSVAVDDSFLKMSPDQQNAAVDEIAKSLNVGKTGSEQPAAPAQPSVDFQLPVRSLGGDLNDLVRSAANGVTLGFADRAAAGMGALTGVGGTQGDYAGNLAKEQGQTEQFKQAHPVEAGIANLAGSAAVPLGAIGAAAKGTNLLTRSILGAGAGAAIGGVQGAASSPDLTDVPQTAKNAAIGAGEGAALGGVIPSAGRVIGTAVRKVADRVNGGVPGLPRAASDHLISAVEADTPAAVTANINRYGPDATLSDAGPALLGKAQGASLNSDEGRSILQGVLTRRNEGTNSRIMGDVNNALGPAEDPQTVVNAIRARRSEVDSQAYPAALNNAPPVDTTQVLANLGPMIGNSVGMENKALSNLRDMLMRDVNGVPVPVTDANLLHKIKGELDNVIEYDQPGLGIPAAALSRQQGALRQMRGQLNSALEQQVPGYAAANAKSAGLAKRGEAVEQGTQYLGSGKTTPSPDRFADEFAQRQPGEKIAFAKGSRGNIERILGTKANDLQALRGELQGEGGWNTAKIGTVHGQDAADQLVNSVDRNLKFRDTYNKVVENSQTAQRTAAANAMKPEPPGEVPLLSPRTTGIGLLLGGAKKGANAVIDALRSDPTASYGIMAKVLSAQGGERDAALQAILDAIARRKQNALMAPAAGDRAAVAAAILGNGYLTDRRGARQ